MHAVIRLGSHQFDVAPGQIITVEKIDGPEGSEVHFKDVLLVADKDHFSVGPEVKASVVGTIRSQLRGPKIDVLRKIRRKGHHRSVGHRQPYTQIEITRIEV